MAVPFIWVHLHIRFLFRFFLCCCISKKIRNEIKTHINPGGVPFAFHLLLSFVYHLSANFQSRWQYFRTNQLEPVSPDRLIGAPTLPLPSSCTVPPSSLIARYTSFLSSASNYQKPVTKSFRRIYSPHTSLYSFFLSIADDLIESKIVADFSHLIPSPLWQGRKSADSLFSPSFK